jgi:dihydrofolate synthase/folylpolyglutamate synthase
MSTVTWPARLQKLTGDLAALAPSCDVWLDGGHNAGGGQALAEAMADLEDRVPRPLYLVAGMLRTKDAEQLFRAVRRPCPSGDRHSDPRA